MYQYDKKALTEGEALYERARALSGRIRRTRGGQYDCTDDIDALWKKLQKMYRLDLILARTEFNGSRGSAAKLGLSGRREHSLRAWIEQVRGFYETLEADAWMRRYLRIARVALDEQPQLLEKLGVIR